MYQSDKMWTIWGYTDNMEKYYKREVSLMDTKIFPRASLDAQIDNPDFMNSIKARPVDKTDEELVEDVVSALKRTGIKKSGTS